MAETIFDRIQRVITEQLEVADEDVKPESNFADDLGADSLDIVELVMALEEEFDVEIPDDAAEGIDTVQKAAEYIEENIK